MGWASQERVLDFAPIGMRWEITKFTADTRGELFEAIDVIAPGFAGPPLHIHPAAEESYAVVSGSLDVCVAGEWKKLTAGESVTVPAGTPHTLKNESGVEIRLVNVHKPAQNFSSSGGFTPWSARAAPSSRRRGCARPSSCRGYSRSACKRSSRSSYPAV